MTLAFDTETFLIDKGAVAPRMVCLSLTDGEEVQVVHRRDPACARLVREMLEGREQICGQNVPFDLAVLANEWPELLTLIFDVYEQDRVVDTMVRQKLIDIARGQYRGYRNGLSGLWVEHKYHLADLAKRHGYPVELDKDTWRLRYNELVDLDVEDWPADAAEYPAHDAMSTFWVWKAQEEYKQLLDDQYRQSRAHWALHLVSAWGVRTDPQMVQRLENLTRAQLDDYRRLLLDAELLVEKKDGSFGKKVKKAQEFAEKAWQLAGYHEIPEAARTDAGKPSLNEDAVEQLTTALHSADDENQEERERAVTLVTAFQKYSSASTILDRVMELHAGTDGPIHTRFDELLVSGRTSSSRPNIQNRATSVMVRAQCGHKLDEKKTKCLECGIAYLTAGDRESFVPREGHVFLISDVPGLELRTIAQSCLKIVGYSRLAEILNAGRDPHIEVAATLKGWSLEDAYRRKKDPGDVDAYLARQTGKVVNFGLNARLGWRGLIFQARTKYGVNLDEKGSKEAIAAYYATLPEMRDFHFWVDANCEQTRVGTAVHLFSNRQRGFVSPTEMSNTYSQGLGADATKAALYKLVRECYVGSGSLLDSRVVNYVHDEYHVETLEEDLDRKGDEMADIICTEANKWLPDVPIPRAEMKPIAARRWSKKAKQILNADGTLGVWEWEAA